MRRTRRLAIPLAALIVAIAGLGRPPHAAPEGQITWGVQVTLAPTRLDHPAQARCELGPGPGRTCDEKAREQVNDALPAVSGRVPLLPEAVGGSLGPIKGAQHHEIGGVMIDAVAAANGQVKRVVYPPGFRWSTHMKPVIGTDLCMHGHVGFLTAGRVKGQYRDGCAFDFAAPAVVVVEPGHDARVVGREAAVLIQFDAPGQTVERFGLPAEHRDSG